MGPAVETLIFLGLGLVFAALLWHDRPQQGRLESWRLLRTLLIVLLPLSAFGAAYLQDKGDRLTVSVTRLRVPQSFVVANAPDPKAFADYLVVGDRAATADLVVPSHADERLALISLAPEPRTFVAVSARPPATAGGEKAMPVMVRLRSFAPLPEMELPGMEVSVAGEAIPAGSPDVRPLTPGRPMAVSLARLDGDGRRAERRSFTLMLVAGKTPSVDLHLTTPLRADAGSCDLPRLRLAPMTAGDAGEAQFRDPENLVFHGLGAGGGMPVLEPQRLGPVADSAMLCGTSETRFSWPTAVQPGDARLGLVSQRAFLPWYCCLFILISALATHGLLAPGWREPTAERIVVPLLQWLLALRLLVAVAGLYNDTSLTPWQVLWDPLASFLCLPLLAAILLRPASPELPRLLVAAALLVAAGFAGIWRGVGGGSATSIPALLCYATIIVALARLAVKDGRAPVAMLSDAIERIRPVRLDRPAAAGLPTLFVAGLAALAAMATVRVGLVLVGLGSGAEMTERVAGLPLSLLYVPGTILCFALMLDGARTMKGRAAATWITGAFLLAYVFVPFATRDVGSIFVCAWPLAALIAWFGLTRLRPTGRQRLIWLLAPATPPLVVVAGALLIAAMGPLPAPDKDLGGHIAQVTRYDRNDVRLLGFLAPDRVEQVGTGYALEAMDLATSLQPLTRDVIGHGYLTPSDVQRPLLDNQYSDNLSAIHIAWPFGRLGLVALLLVMIVGTAALVPPASARRDPDWLTLASLGAGLSFAWAALYMVLANLDWVPFTGRNLYLLAATSGGDLAEGLALLMLMALPFAARPAPPGEPG